MEPQEPIDSEAIVKLINSLREPEFRASFLKDPQTTLSRNEISRESIPDRLFHRLTELTAPELRLLGELADTFASFPTPEGGWPMCL